jgi:hypothetical protein
MALVLADRVKETTTSTGTTAITLAGAATGYQTFSSAVGNANTTYYTIADQTGANWEVGIGTYTTIGNTLSRDTVLASSNAGSLVDFTTGVKDVFVSYPAERALYSGGNLGTPASGTLTNCTGYTYANLSGTVPTWNQNTTGTAANLTAATTLPSGMTLVAPVLGTPASGNLSNCTFPTLNQNTTGTAAGLSATLAISYGGTGATTLAGAKIPVWDVVNTFTGTQTFSGTSTTLAAILTNAAETTTVSATAATGTIAYYTSSQSVLYYTSNASANWTINIRHSAGTTLNTAMAVGQTITVTHMVTNGATAFYNNVVQVDGTVTGVTTKWQGGAPTTGDASAVNCYTYAIIKTGAATFTVFAAVAKFS